MCVTKNELEEHIRNECDVKTKKQASAIVDAIFDKIEVSLIKGDDVKIDKFGIFTIAEKKGRIVPNPRELSEKIVIPNHKNVKFKAATTIKYNLRRAEEGLLVR